MIYIFLLFGIGILSLIKKKIKQKIVIDTAIIVIMVIVYGIRYNVGRDYLSYEIIYKNEYGWYNYEFLYTLSTNFFKFLNAPFWVFNVFLGFIIFYLMYLISKDLNIGYEKIVLYFILTGQLFVSFNLVRQTIAAMIIMFAFRYITRKNIIKYAIGVIIASLFHTSAIIFIPLYFLKNINLNIRRVVTLVILGIMLYFFNIISLINYFFVPDKYMSLLGSILDYNPNPGIGALFYISIALILSLKTGQKDSDYYPFIITYILFNSLLLFTLSSFVVSRLTMYGHMAIVPVIPYLFIKLKIENNLFKIAYIIFLLAYFILFASTIIDIFSVDTNNLMYRTIFDNSL
ncbi:EpsG family protein [Paenibacillus sp. NPDC101420]|uniref:EpsG family protein n=1 Tax=Paenibacillus sp. NPDC101420 TaxID=3390602 RepID=UPI003D01AA62